MYSKPGFFQLVQHASAVRIRLTPLVRYHRSPGISSDPGSQAFQPQDGIRIQKRL